METKNKKNRRRLLIVLLVLLVGGCCAGGWLLLGDRLTGRGPAGPETSVTPVVQPADTPEGADEPATPAAADPESGKPAINETEPETSAPTPPTEPSQAHENGGGSTASGNTSSGSGNGSSGSSGSKGGASTPAPVPTPTPTPTPTPRPTPAPAPAPAPAPHTHKYADTRTEPTCTQPGQIVYTCSCGDVQTEILAALGHDHSEAIYETRTYEVVTGMECHTICRACGHDFNPGGVYEGDDVYNAHMGEHLRKGESSSTYEEWIEITETVTEQVHVGHKCSRCGDVKYLPQ